MVSAVRPERASVERRGLVCTCFSIALEIRSNRSVAGRAVKEGVTTGLLMLPVVWLQKTFVIVSSTHCCIVLRTENAEN